MKAQYQVVAVYPSGRRFPVKAPHDSFDGALWHREACERWVRECEPESRQDLNVYEIDVRYIGADGQLHWRGGIDGLCSSVRVAS